MFVAIRLIIQMHTELLRWRLNLTLRISQGSVITYFRWSGHFRHSFVKGFFRDNRSNFYWNLLIFDREQKISWHSFFETRCRPICCIICVFLFTTWLVMCYQPIPEVAVFEWRWNPTPYRKALTDARQFTSSELGPYIAPWPRMAPAAAAVFVSLVHSSHQAAARS